MTRNSDSRPQHRSERPERAIDPVLLNALADVASDERRVLADEASDAIVGQALTDATSAAERERFRDVIGRLRTTGEMNADSREAVDTVVDAVRDHLTAAGTRVTVDHEVPIPADPVETAVYDFTMTRDATRLTGLDLPEAVGDHVEDGARLSEAGEFEAAAEAFTRATDEAKTGDGSVTARTLTAWAHHWAGDDHAAIDFVEEALHLHTDAWLPTLAGFSADPDPAFARPQQFRDGKYAAMAALRYTVDTPDGTSLTPALARRNDDGEIDSWVELEGTDECTPIHRLGAGPVLRLRLTGEVPAFPAIHSYYVGLGIVDLEVTELREVYRLLVNGPAGDGVTETITVERTD
ncbi:hypothetical protein [Salinirubrum litoreum]|uniref:Uncharacterized protein n=1 Tax=Salinirubrum litoreum TaxID=1126234 RepID=A0ABD5RG50_9EURY|nr:hypothetical protein [Salinirubrum litoreum]